MLLALLLAVATLGAGPVDAGAPDADRAAEEGAGRHSADVSRLTTLATKLRELTAGELAHDEEPASLFDIDLRDEDAVRVERRRLEAVLGASSVADAGVDAAAAKPAPTGKRPKPVPDAGLADAGAEAAAPPSANEEAIWEARLEVDRARLAFLSLAPEAREKLLSDHARRKDEALQKLQADDQAKQRAQQAAKDRDKALEDARLARSEAERRVAEERARLLGVKEAQAKYEAELIRDEEAVKELTDDTLIWSRKVSEMVTERVEGRAQPEAADRLYLDLRKRLRDARGELGTALGQLRSVSSKVPGAGPDPLEALGSSVDRGVVDALRDEIGTAASKLERHERLARWGRAKALAARVESMNRDRLALYPYLSPGQRDAITSFSPEGWDQARAEGYQVALIARYHLETAASWLSSFKDPERARFGDLFATFTLLEMLGLGIVFFWWRRTSDPLLEALRARIAPEPRVVRRAPSASWAERGVALLTRVHRPLEWLLLAWALLALAGPKVANLYEARILWLVLSWTMGGLVVVYLMDELLGDMGASTGSVATAELRLRSFKLVGRVVVAIGLTLALTRDLVGQGTIHGWVLSTCWFMALPVGAVLARWWRTPVFERLERQKKKSALAAWLLDRSAGWASVPASAVGGSYLIVTRGAKALRAYVGRFGVTRRALAYLFRREVAKQATAERRKLDPIDRAHAKVFDPDLPADVLLESVAQREIEAVIASIDAPRGGVFALVGERGAGKTTVARRIIAGRPDSLMVQCPPGGYEPFRRELLRVLGLGPDASDADICRVIDQKPEDNALLVDDAQRLVRPIIGGLDDFDRALALARASSGTCTWVFCIGAGIWQYVARARGARPAFDQAFQLEPWSEDQIGTLLSTRAREVGLDVHFDRLIVDPESDAELYGEQLARAEESYYRLLWDHAGGNPAVTLHFWQRSLRVGEDGEVVIQLFEAPDIADLESLPDSAVFVLRAVVQLELAAFPDILDATRLPSRDVEDALRYGVFRGYLETIDGRYRVDWHWFRAVTRFLERRHLLSKGV